MLHSRLAGLVSGLSALEATFANNGSGGVGQRQSRSPWGGKALPTGCPRLWCSAPAGEDISLG